MFYSGDLLVNVRVPEVDNIAEQIQHVHQIPLGNCPFKGNLGFPTGQRKFDLSGENPEKNPRSKDENQQQTQPTCDAGSGNQTRATAVGGERSHHCAIPAPLCKVL